MIKKIEIVKDKLDMYKMCIEKMELKFNYKGSKFYYPLNDVNASFPFPNIVPGKDTVLLVTDEYSIIQYYNDKDSNY